MVTHGIVSGWKTVIVLSTEVVPLALDKHTRCLSKRGKCLKCGSRVSFADVIDTIVFVGDEIVKRCDGGITNRNCVRCNYPEQYADYEEHDEVESQNISGIL